MSAYSIQAMLLALLAVLGIISGAAVVSAQQNISTEIARAESMYYGAQFQPALILLLDLEMRVGNDPQRTADRLKIKLLIGLTYLGQNQIERARLKFVEVCVLDNMLTLKPQEFSPKVITLFEEAKAICAQNFCVDICAKINALIGESRFEAAEVEIKAAGAQCPCVAASTGAISRARFKRAQELYDRGQFADAAKEFGAVLAIDSDNALARDYSKLSKERLELAVEQAYTDWRGHFESRQFESAAAGYERIRTSNVEPLSGQLASLIQVEYGKVLSGLVSSWKAACASGDVTKRNSIRTEATAVASGLPFNSAALAEMDLCTQPAQTIVLRNCIQGDPALAVNRLRNRVNPQIDPSLQRYVSRGIRVSIEIDEAGNVEVKQIANTNARLAEALRSAVEQWKFYPAVIDNQPRCVQTELPINLIQRE